MKILYKCMIFIVLISVLCITTYAVNTHNSSDTVVTDTPCPYEDIKGHWSEKYVTYTTQNNLIDGITATEFKPNDPMTREMFVIALTRLMNVTSDPIKWAIDNELLLGYGNGNLGLEDTITREQMAVFFERYFNLTGTDISVLKLIEKKDFTDDSAISDWAKSSVYKMQEIRLLQGKENHIFDPLDLTSRAEGATVLYNLSRILTYPTAEELFSITQIKDTTKYSRVNMEKFIKDEHFSYAFVDLLVETMTTEQLADLLDSLTSFSEYQIPEETRELTLPKDEFSGLESISIFISLDAEHKQIIFNLAEKNAKWCYGGYIEGFPENNQANKILSNDDLKYIESRLKDADLSSKDTSYRKDAQYGIYSYSLYLNYKDGYVKYSVSNSNTGEAGEIISLCKDLFNTIFNE